MKADMPVASKVKKFVPPVGRNFSLDEIPFSKSIVLKSLEKARLDGPKRNEYRTSYSDSEVKLFDR